jgi:hypothetical protein
MKNVQATIFVPLFPFVVLGSHVNDLLGRHRSSLVLPDMDSQSRGSPKNVRPGPQDQGWCLGRMIGDGANQVVRHNIEKVLLRVIEPRPTLYNALINYFY